MGFTVKNHEARVVPLRTDVVEMLEARYKSRPPHNRWLFVSGNREPEGHFLRKLKTHALGLLFVWRDSLRKDRGQHVRSRGAIRERRVTAQRPAKNHHVRLGPG